MKEIILDITEKSIEVKQDFINKNFDLILKGADKIAQCIASGHKVMLFGNGGSAADSQHIAAEFINRFEIERHPLPAIALTTDTSIITSIGNDYHFDLIFSKQVAGLGKKGDIAVGISTSGNSKNVVEAILRAKEMGIFTIGVTGKNGGKAGENCDMLFAVNSTVTARIQETHILLFHIFCSLTDKILFPESFIIP